VPLQAKIYSLAQPDRSRFIAGGQRGDWIEGNHLVGKHPEMGHANAIVTNNDPHDFQRLPGYFDAVVVDAPCSAKDSFRKDPEAMNEWSPGAVDLCSQRQRRILHDIWPSLKQNGILVYCTCTYNEKENEDNLRWLQQQKGLESIELVISPSWEFRNNERKHRGVRFYPHRLQGEGFLWP